MINMLQYNDAAINYFEMMDQRQIICLVYLVYCFFYLFKLTNCIQYDYLNAKTTSHLMSL